MKFWFDTEFYEDGLAIHLISIGVVAEDGRTYYAESPNAYNWARQSLWLISNVLPRLEGRIKATAQVRRELIEFFGEKPEIWAYYGAYDWVALCQLYGRMIDLPKGWPFFCRDVKQLCCDLGDPELPKQTTPEHHALNDALWTQDVWTWLCHRRAMQASGWKIDFT